MTDAAWTTLAERVVVQDRFVDLRAETVRTGAGVVLDPYWVMHLPDWVAVLAVTPDERVVLVRQWRQAARRWVLEPPGGVIDEGDPVAAALRELREETGYAAAQARYVGAMFSDPSRNTNRLHVVVAEGVTLAGAPEREASEEMVVEMLDLAALRAGYARGLLGNALHVAVVAMALEALDQP